VSHAGYDVVAVALVVLGTVCFGLYGVRLARTTSDFLVASRSVTPLWNASAIGGEYLSAASFLGIAGLVMLYGADMLWYPVGFVAGYVVLLLLVAAPLRRSGAYTVPDFAELRLESLLVRRLSSVLVVVIGWLYLVPQLQGAGLTLHAVTGAPSWAGAAVVSVVVTASVAGGGMRSATFVQAFQFWLKLTALAVPALVLVLTWRGDGAPDLSGPQTPVFRSRTVVQVDRAVTVEVLTATAVQVDGLSTRLEPGRTVLAAGSTLVFPAGAVVPHRVGAAASTGDSWQQPLSGAGGRSHPLYATYALVLATFLGTMGLPHVLVRFYTNPDGATARRTTLAVLVLLGLFYLLPALYGALGRLYAPGVLTTGTTDTVVLALPAAMLGGLPGTLLEALLVAGAFAAFLSTSSGLMVSTAGVLSQDVLRGTVADFRRSAVFAGLIPLLLALPAHRLPIGVSVGLAFAFAASTFCPLLVLGIWWRGLTATGAAAGLVVGGGLSALAILATLAGVGTDGWSGALLAQPAVWTVPTAFAVMVLGSLLTRSAVPSRVALTMRVMHTPEALGTPSTGTAG
jgi:Na+(H+)/acetate symporter ActP